MIETPRSQARHRVYALLPVIFLALLIALSGGEALSADKLTELLSRACVLSLAGVGAVFVFTVGAFGISLGASTLTCVIVGALTWVGTGDLLLSFLCCIGLAIFNCVLSSLLTTFCRLPPYVTAVLMLSVLFAVGRSMIGDEPISVGLSGGALDSPTVRFFAAAIYFSVCCYLFFFTPLGSRQMLLGDDPERARLLGVERVPYGALAFLIAGVGVGACAFLILCSQDAVIFSVTSDLGINIILAILLGGMPLSGGIESSPLAAVVGSLSTVMIDDLLFYLLYGFESRDAVAQVIKAVIVLVLVIVLSSRRRPDTN